MTTPPWPIAPMKASPGNLPSNNDGTWMFEPKWDGHRGLVRIRGGRVDAVSSTGQQRMERWPWLAGITAVVSDGDAVLDGEVIAVDDSGRHSFEAVGRADRAHAFVMFDVLVASGRDLTGRPWSERRSILDDIVARTAEFPVTPCTDDAEGLFAATKANGFEGIVAKQIGSIYQPGRRVRSWLKIKHRYEQEVVVGGYLSGEGGRSSSFGSLLLGVYEADALRFIGAVGTGFRDETLRTINAQLQRVATTECPFDPVPKLPGGTFHWVRPELVAEVTFAEWTEAGHLRHPVFLGMRDDKDPRDITRESL
ncbi:MAG TPA: non-homologous end-joining DNA ligase, partial [Ilumatobacteraceae bacterium]